MVTPKSRTSNGGTAIAVAGNSSHHANNPERERIFNAYRQWGYLEGDLDPLGFLRPRETSELQREGEFAREADVYKRQLNISRTMRLTKSPTLSC